MQSQGRLERPCIFMDHEAERRKLIHGPRYRVRVFVDFWNYTLLMKDVDGSHRTDWSKIGPVLAQAAAVIVGSEGVSEYQGLNFYGSYNPSTEPGRNLHGWAKNVVGTFPGVSVSMVPRKKKKSPPVCPACHVSVGTCKECGSDMRGTEEKGVDVRMATDMISLAWVKNYEIAVLVSSDGDFVPVAEFLETKGIKVIHGAFPPKGAQLSTKCWGKIDVALLRNKFRQIKK